jgi:hypothetical protein
MDRLGIDKAVVFPFNDVDQGPTFCDANTRVAGYVKEHPDRVIGFARLDPHFGDQALEELERSLSLGLKGVKLHPAGQNFSPDHPTVLKIIQKAAGHGVPVVFDNGKPISPNDAIGRLAGEVPEATIILAHMRGEGFIEAAEEHGNIYLGTVKALDLDVIEDAISRVGPERILAGSDYPYAPMEYEMVEKWDEMGLSGREREMITGGNMAGLLNLRP